MIIKPLTSLRFFFAFFVFLSHLSFLENSKFYSLIYNQVFKEGFLGVSFFFILSGFVLSLNYNTITKSYIRKFYLYRLARIYPVYLLTLLLSIFIVKGSVYKFIIQIFSIQSFFPNQEIYFSYNAPSWSISDEFFFYLLFPFIISFFRKISFTLKTIVTIILCVTVISITTYTPIEKQHYYIYIFPLMRIVDFIIGIYL
ncbi:acyltransferase family protein, partial [Chishuiella changwenlii]